MTGITTFKGRLTRKSHRYIIAIGIVICLAAMAMAAMVYRSEQAPLSSPVPVSFIGEYSQNGGAWNTLTENTHLNALNGDLVLRGHFDYEKDEALLHAYLDNISMTVVVDGEEELSILNPDPAVEGTAGTRWIGWTSKAFAAKEVEIHLSNDNTVGNPNAYDDFLGKLYTGPNQIFENYILSPGNYFSRNIEYEGAALWAAFLSSGQFWRVIGFGVFVIAMLLFGVALADSLQSRLFGRKLWLLGALALFSVGAIVLDTQDASLWHMSIAFNTCGAQLCRMMWMLMLSLCAVELQSGRRRSVAFIAASVGGIFDAGAFLLLLTGKINITDILPPWVVLQAIICLMLILSCAMEIKDAVSRNQRLSRAALMLILCAVAAELWNARFGLWQRGILLHSVFVLLLLICGVYTIKRVPAAYRASKQAAALEAELVQSRISIMLSQIQPHFLYNALNSIRQLCKSDPGAAQTAIEDFAKYLRGNLDSIKRNTPVPFTKEKEHIRIYLALEKMRFEDELQVVWNVETDSFMLPALTVQPLVENAVEYGVGKKPGGGTVTVSTKETPNAYIITVKDDGVGYDPMEIQDDGRTHTGIDNVRSRLTSMCGGVLTIETAPGLGTTATVCIPKEAKHE